MREAPHAPKVLDEEQELVWVLCVQDPYVVVGVQEPFEGVLWPKRKHGHHKVQRVLPANFLEGGAPL